MYRSTELEGMAEVGAELGRERLAERGVVLVRSSALASTKVRAACWLAGRVVERCFPTVSMAGLMSLMVTRTSGLWLTTWAV